jgi:hypothetical protein
MRTYSRKLVILMLLIGAFVVLAGCKKKRPRPFGIGIETIQVEGTVTDSLSTQVTVTLDGTPVSLSGSNYNETVDMTGKTDFTLEATDEAGNKSSLNVEM